MIDSDDLMRISNRWIKSGNARWIVTNISPDGRGQFALEVDDAEARFAEMKAEDAHNAEWRKKIMAMKPEDRGFTEWRLWDEAQGGDAP